MFLEDGGTLAKVPSSGGVFPTKEEAFHLLGKDLIAWFQDMHSCEDHSSSVSGIICESLPDQVPQTHWWENLFSVSYPVTGFPSTLPLSKAHGYYVKTEGLIGSNWRGSFWWLELFEIAPVVVMFPQTGW